METVKKKQLHVDQNDLWKKSRFENHSFLSTTFSSVGEDEPENPPRAPPAIEDKEKEASGDKHPPPLVTSPSRGPEAVCQQDSTEVRTRNK